MNIEKLVLDLCSYDDEQEWFEFKENWFQPEVLVMKIIVLEGSPNKNDSSNLLADCFKQGAEDVYKRQGE